MSRHTTSYILRRCVACEGVVTASMDICPYCGRVFKEAERVQ